MEDREPASDPHPLTRLSLVLLGTPIWRAPGGKVQPLSRKDAALLAILALDGPQAREVLAGRLWPDVDQRRAASSLRQRVTRLRRDTGHAVLRTGPAVRLADGVTFDLAAVATMGVDELLAAGELLAGFDYGDNDFLDGWVADRRELLRRARADALAGHAHCLEASGELAAALRLNGRILALVPQQEHAWRRQMRLHYLRGDRAAAVEAFERFEAALREQTGGRPGDETLELLRTIEHVRREPERTRAVLPASLMRPPVLVGREPELRAMARAWSSGRAFVVIAGAGLGKSRLLSEHLQGRPCTLTEQARAGDRRAPYSSLVRLLRNLLLWPGLVLADPTRAELARILPEAGAATHDAGQQTALWGAVETLLAQAALAGLQAVAFDDLQYADLATFETLRWLSASGALGALRFGFATRPFDDADASELLRDWLVDSSRPESIELSLLAPADVTALVDSLGLPELWPAALGPALFRHAGGHPFFTLETLKDLVLHGHDAGRDALPSPATAQTLLEQRLRGLPLQALDLLRLAAVAGADLTVERAARLLRRDPMALAAPWAELEAANVLQGLAFAHDLVRDCALRLVPTVVRRALHADVAQVLAEDATVPPGRVAEHWEAAERWPEAARCLHAAGLAARYAGRLVEQQALLERAASCHRRAGNTAGEFDVTHDSLDGLLVRSGGAAVLAELPRMNALARTAEQRLKSMLMHTEALLDVTRSDEAEVVAAAAVALARAHPRRLADALGMHGMALAQCGRPADAIPVQREGAELARASGDKAQALRATNALAFVLFSASQIHDAVLAQREAVQLAGEIGDNTELALAEGNLATFLSVIGDPPATYRQAVRARSWHQTLGSSVNGTQGGLNLINLGGAAAYLGRFDEALGALAESVQVLGERAAGAASAKARIALAGLWLTLGCADTARAGLTDMPLGTPPVMQAQWHLTLARASLLDGRTGVAEVQRATDVLAAHAAVKTSSALWFEWARHGDPMAAVDGLRQVGAACLAQGQHGVSRALAVREIARRADTAQSAEDLADTAAQAAALLPHVAQGMHASVYPPEAWLVLAQALERGGQHAAAQACRANGAAWIREVGLRNVAVALRDRFLEGNPVNRALLRGDDRAAPG